MSVKITTSKKYHRRASWQAIMAIGVM